MGDERKKGTERTPETVIEHFYARSRFFRTIHVDGIYGGPGLTPGTIQFAVFTERIPYPERTVDINGMEDIPRRQTPKGVERELEASLVMTLPVAKSIRQWLDERIQYLEAQESTTAAS